MFSRSFIVSALLGFVAAQKGGMAQGGMSTSTPSSAGSAPAGMAMTHIIQVGGPNGTLAFWPNNVKAQAGDLIQFQFHPKNHSVVQSTFDNPCVPIGDMMSNKTDAFFSGFMPTNASFGSTSNVLTYTIRVKDTKPMWFYCSQGKHCQAGMVGAINAPASGNRTMKAFAALAAQAPENLSPGEATGSGGSGGKLPPTPSGTSPDGTNGGGNPPPGSPAGNSPPQQSTNDGAALGQQSFFSLIAAAIVAFVML